MSIVNRIKDKWLITLCAVVLASIVIPIYIGAFYAVPASDDLSYTANYINYGGNLFKFLFWNVKNYYLTWQGGFSAIFLASIPTFYLFGIPGLVVEFLICSTIFFVVLFLFIKAIVNQMGADSAENNKVALYLMTTCLFYVLGVNGISEIFYWHTGVMEYMMTTVCSFMSVIVYLKFRTVHKKKVWLVMGCIFAIGGAGGLLNISAFMCAMLLFCVAYDLMETKKLRWEMLIFVIGVLFSLVNAVAPGNFARHTHFDSGVRVGDMLFLTITKVNQVISIDIMSGLLLFIVIISFILGTKSFRNSSFDFKLPGLVTVYAYFSIVITDFPVVLGYSGTNFPVRCDFSEKLAVVLFVAFTALYWGGWFGKNYSLSFSREQLLIIGLICLIPLSAYFDVLKFREFTPYKMIWHISNGDFKKASDRQKSIYTQLEFAEGDEVVVRISAPAEGEWANIMSSGAGDSMDNYVNASMATIYGKTSVIVVQE